MSPGPTTELPERYRLHVHREIDIRAPLTIVFDSVLEQLGPGHDMPTDGQPMPMKLEPWPGGRWLRDLGNNSGHFWGHVQVIKPPRLLEITGPLFMSFPAISHLQFLLAEHDAGTRLSFVHRALGDIPPEYLEGAPPGWDHRLARIRQYAESVRVTRA
jgi:hypothetical protein